MKILKESNASIGSQDINEVMFQLIYGPIARYLNEKYKGKLNIWIEDGSGIPFIVIAHKRYTENYLCLSITTSGDWHKSYNYTLFNELAEQETDFDTLDSVCDGLNTRFGLNR